MGTESRLSTEALKRLKGQRPIAALTAYDYPTGALTREAGVDIVLAGDSLGMVALGYPDTSSVTMDDILRAVEAVKRARPRGALVADLPIGSYRDSDQAALNARRLVDAGADAVKAEGGRVIADQVVAIRAAGIAYMGHLGILPQSVRSQSDYRIVGREADARKALLEDAAFLDSQGAFSLVLELVEPGLAQEITAAISMPTIGIGSGACCDGQVLVITDLLHLTPETPPRHAKPPVNYFERMRETIVEWKLGLGNRGRNA